MNLCHEVLQRVSYENLQTLLYSEQLSFHLDPQVMDLYHGLRSLYPQDETKAHMQHAVATRGSSSFLGVPVLNLAGAQQGMWA